MALQPQTTPFNTLTDRLTQLEEEKATALTAVAGELKSDVGLLESRLTDPHKKPTGTSVQRLVPSPTILLLSNGAL